VAGLKAWTVGGLAEAARGSIVAGDPGWPVEGISLDSRRVTTGQAFVALKGVRFDAHAFLPDVVRAGVRCVVVSDVPAGLDGAAVIRVPDTTTALGAIAAAHRAAWARPVVAITGSCGKTTTKELLAAALSDGARVLKTHLNENNHIGLPLTLLRLTAEDAIAVVELGSNHPGEIANLAGIAQATVAAVTNVGPAHLEFFGSMQGVMDEKLSLLTAMRPGGTAIVPGDQLEVVLEAKRRVPRGVTLLTFGVSGQCGLQGLDIRRVDDGWAFRVRGVMGEFVLQMPGSHNVENALAALACARALGIPLESLREPLSQCRPLPMRSELIRRGSMTLINDCYNANPLSFARALESLADLRARRRMVIAGDMRELGAHATAGHRAIGRLAAERGIDVIVAVGEHAAEIAQGAREAGRSAEVFGSVEALLGALPSILHAGDGILVKGSRGVHLERAVEWLLARADAHDRDAGTEAVAAVQPSGVEPVGGRRA
jgi:UDP-N-acetylmuramoyl-tripeptide--D-alanyl-D-alanine ligase